MILETRNVSSATSLAENAGFRPREYCPFSLFYFSLASMLSFCFVYNAFYPSDVCLGGPHPGPSFIIVWHPSELNMLSISESTCFGHMTLIPCISSTPHVLMFAIDLVVIIAIQNHLLTRTRRIPRPQRASKPTYEHIRHLQSHR